jgi:hypothetical protein
MLKKPQIIAFRPSAETWSILQSRIDEAEKSGFRPTLTAAIQALLNEAHQAKQKLAANAAQGEAI